MKALMVNSTNPRVMTAKMRDEQYLKHLRQVQRINNRQALILKNQLKQYNDVNQSYEKSRKIARQFGVYEQNHEIQRKNEMIHSKIKNIRSMFNLSSMKKSQKRSQSVLLPGEKNIQASTQKTSRYHLKQNQQIDQIIKINDQIEQNIKNGVNTLLKNNQPAKKNRLSMHYYLRKRQQQMIQYENAKLINGIINQKSTYSSPKKKINQSLKLPSLNAKSARKNLNTETQNGKKIQNESQNKIQNRNKIEKPEYKNNQGNKKQNQIKLKGQEVQTK